MRPADKSSPASTRLPTRSWTCCPPWPRRRGVAYRSNTLGRNLLDPRNDQDAAAFISASDDTRFLIKDGYCFARRPDAAQNGLYKLDAPTAENLLSTEPDRAAAMERQVEDFYQTSKYLLHHNGKDALAQAAPVPAP